MCLLGDADAGKRRGDATGHEEVCVGEEFLGDEFDVVVDGDYVEAEPVCELDDRAAMWPQPTTSTVGSDSCGSR